MKSQSFEQKVTELHGTGAELQAFCVGGGADVFGRMATAADSRYKREHQTFKTVILFFILL